MGRNFNGWMVVFSVALGVAVAPAEAKDRKSAAREREAVADMIAAREARSVAMRQEPAGGLTTRSAAASGTVQMSSTKPNGKPTAPLAEQQAPRSNPFRFNIGAVTVQPTVGGIKGAQFSIGF